MAGITQTRSDPGPVGDSDTARYLAGMERLVQAVTDLAGARTLDQVTLIVRTAARELCGADGATFVLRDADQCFYVEEDAIAPLWRGSRFPMETCISGWAMLNRLPAVIPDIYADDRIPHDAYRPTFVKSLVMVPVRTAEPVAAIGNYWADTHDPTDTEVRLLQALADSTAVALEHVRTLEELEHRVQSRTAELRETNASLEQFAGIAAHDLKGPLDTMANLISALRARAGDKLNDAESNLLDALEHSGHRLADLIPSLLEYARAGGAAPKVRPFDPAALIADATAAIAGLLEESGATVTVGELPDTVTGDQTLLTQVVQNLIANAAIHGGTPANPAAITISGRRTTNHSELDVADDGPGVPAAEREVIFEPFRQGAGAQPDSGSGLGLSLCRRIARAHGGDLEVGDAPSGGAVFTIRLPAGDD